MAFKAFFGSEARQLQKDKPAEFEKKYASYKKALKSRLKTFEKHGRGESSSAQKLQAAFFDAEQAYTTSERTLALSRMSLVLTSARGSYSKSLKIDKKIVASLNEHFGEDGKPFIKVSELDEFGRIMDGIKDMSLDKIYGSSQVIQIVRDIMDKKKVTNKNWRELLTEALGGQENDVQYKHYKYL